MDLIILYSQSIFKIEKYVKLLLSLFLRILWKILIIEN